VAISLLGSAALLGAFLLAAHEFRSGRIDGAVLVAVVLVAMALAEVIGPLRRAALAFGRTQLAARRLMPLLSDAHARPHRAPRIMIRRCDPCRFALRDVGFRYAGRSTPVLASFDLDIAPGERIALAGASGSGKSTLLAMLAGLARPTSGTIRADGLLLESLPLGDHLARVGFLAQRTEIFNDTMAANLRLAAPDADDAALWAALQMVELDTKVRTMPGGLSARLGEAGAGLSGGEARRLALARIVLKSPAVWLLDEPTAGLDEALAHRVMDNVMHHARGATVIIATHHAREAHHARRIVRLDPVRRDEIASMGRLPHDMSGHQTAKQ
jgi:ATP-binding cassette subfamily C protein CydC